VLVKYSSARVQLQGSEEALEHLFGYYDARRSSQRLCRESHCSSGVCVVAPLALIGISRAAAWLLPSASRILRPLVAWRLDRESVASHL